jgi:hypothetical protein
MAATTITRASLTDGVSVWNAALVGSAIYDKIDAVIAGTITFGGLVRSEGFGDHLFAAGGTGANVVIVRNTSSGAGNYAEFRLGNDSNSAIGRVVALSSNYTSSGLYSTAGVTLAAGGAGGLSIAATDAGGEVRFYAGGTTEIAKFDTSGNLQLGRGLRFTGSYDQSVTGTVNIDSGALTYGVVRITTATSTPAIGGGPVGTDGEVLILLNASGAACALKHNYAGPGQRIYCANATDGTLGDKEAVMLVFDYGANAWFQVGPQ